MRGCPTAHPHPLPRFKRETDTGYRRQLNGPQLAFPRTPFKAVQINLNNILKIVAIPR